MGKLAINKSNSPKQTAKVIYFNEQDKKEKDNYNIKSGILQLNNNHSAISRIKISIGISLFFLVYVFDGAVIFVKFNI